MCYEIWVIKSENTRGFSITGCSRNCATHIYERVGYLKIVFPTTTHIHSYSIEDFL